jgi:NADH-quinone oxidoreductase subunit F
VDWLYKILDKIERGDGEQRDVELLLSVCDNIGGKTLCPFGDAEIAPVLSTIQHFRDEYETYIKTGESPVQSDFRATEPVGAH